MLDHGWCHLVFVAWNRCGLSDLRSLWLRILERFSLIAFKKTGNWKVIFSCCFIVTIIVAGADPTLKDDLGHTAMEYAGGEKIREFLSNKMELVWINGLIVIFYLLVSEQNSRNCMQKGIIPIDRSHHQFYFLHCNWVLMVSSGFLICCLLLVACITTLY